MNTAREFKFGVKFIAVLELTQKITAARNFRNGARNFGGTR